MANIDLEKLTLLYEGKAKQVYATDNKDEYIVHYKDDATAFNGEKHDTILGKGVLNNKISSFFFELLKKEGVPTHFVRREDDRNQTVLTLKIVPLKLSFVILRLALWLNALALKKVHHLNIQFLNSAIKTMN